MRGIKTNSLAFRLVASAAAWSVVSLIVAGFILANLFEDAVVRAFDDRLESTVSNLLALAEVNEQTGEIRLKRELGDQTFERAFSGWYWQIARADSVGEGREAVDANGLRSRSLWDQTLAPPPADGSRELRGSYGTGPDNEPLRMLSRDVGLPGSDATYTFTVAGDRRALEEEIASFNTSLAWAFALLGAGLLGAVFLQVRVGLSPLDDVRRALADIRSGRKKTLEGDFPAEIAPLADELNGLVRHNAEIVDRARTQVGNLAHALKTPLSVLKAEEGAYPGPLADQVRKQVATMERQVEHYLSRARTAARADVLGAHAPVEPVAKDIARALERIYSRQGIEVHVASEPTHVFRGEPQDLEEILGNLMENACKWARSEVRASSAIVDGWLQVTVEDDGKGLPAAERERVLERGARLDEQTPGSGLGLSIVKDIAEAYRGAISLADSDLGGLKATLCLPAVEEIPAKAAE